MKKSLNYFLFTAVMAAVVLVKVFTSTPIRTTVVQGPPSPDAGVTNVEVSGNVIEAGSSGIAFGPKWINVSQIVEIK